MLSFAWIEQACSYLFIVPRIFEWIAKPTVCWEVVVVVFFICEMSAGNDEVTGKDFLPSRSHFSNKLKINILIRWTHLMECHDISLFTRICSPYLTLLRKRNDAYVFYVISTKRYETLKRGICEKDPKWRSIWLTCALQIEISNSVGTLSFRVPVLVCHWHRFRIPQYYR